jgi:hypothetical protein
MVGWLVNIHLERNGCGNISVASVKDRAENAEALVRIADLVVKVWTQDPTDMKHERYRKEWCFLELSCTIPLFCTETKHNE